MGNRIKTVEVKTWVIVALSLLVGILLVWIKMSTQVDDVKFNSEEAYLLSEGWTVTYNGQSEEVTVPSKVSVNDGEIVELTRVLEEESDLGNSLIFYARQSWIEVYLDEEQILESAEDRVTPFDMTPGSYWYFFRLPSDYSGKTLRIVFDYTYDRYAGELPSIYIGTKAAFIYMVLKQGQYSLMLVIPVLILGIALWIISILSKQRMMRKRLCRLGLFAIATSVWSLLESRVTQVLYGNMVVASYVLFVCFMLIPFFAAAFLLTYESLRKRWYMKALFWLSAFSFVLAQVLQIMGLVYYIEMVTIVHILLALVIISVLVSYIQMWRNKEDISDKSIYRAMMILGVFCAIDILSYYMRPTAAVGSYSKVGLLLFFAYLGIGAIEQVSRLQIQDAENRLYQKLAYTDMMTGLSNRTAFEADLESYRQRPWEEFTILMVGDMNRLKYINDKYGHAQGDRALKQVAELMKQEFGENCKCYRTGGDEFCVISRGIPEKQFANMCKHFMRSVIESPQEDDWMISVSCGYCIVDESGIDECYRKADTFMYAEKEAYRREQMLKNMEGSHE